MRHIKTLSATISIKFIILRTDSSIINFNLVTTVMGALLKPLSQNNYLSNNKSLVHLFKTWEVRTENNILYGKFPIVVH